MNDYDGMNRRPRGAAEFPVARVAFFRVAENFRTVLTRHPLLEFDGECAEHAGGSPSAARPSAVNAMLHANVGFSFSPSAVVGHALAEVIAGAISPSHRRAGAAS